MAASFDRIVRDAQALPVSGWDTSPVEGRWTHRSPPWDYRRSVLELSASTRTLLDLGTGGGEFLATLAPLPPSTYATEGYAANVPIARRRLEPLGVRVISIGSDGHIDLPAESVGLVVCRHEAFDPVEVRRVLSRRGTFVTQQVGALNYSEIHQRFAVAHSTPANAVQSARSLAEEISSAGLAVSEQREARYAESFRDVGALVWFLRFAPWEVPGFSVERFRGELLEIHQEILRGGEYAVTAHRLLVVARRD